MSKNFLYLRGQPATGKITVARILEKELGWRVFWFHDLKNAVYDIVKEHRIPRLMDDVTKPVLEYLLERGDSIIYVRPSPDKETVESVLQLAARHKDYAVHSVQLTAEYDTLLERVEARNDPYRIGSKEELDGYVNSRTVSPVKGEIIVATDNKTPEQVAKEVSSAVQS